FCRLVYDLGSQRRNALEDISMAKKCQVYRHMRTSRCDETHNRKHNSVVDFEPRSTSISRCVPRSSLTSPQTGRELRVRSDGVPSDEPNFANQDRHQPSTPLPPIAQAIRDSPAELRLDFV